jgi:hypothetical protein
VRALLATLSLRGFVSSCLMLNFFHADPLPIQAEFLEREMSRKPYFIGLTCAGRF